MENLPNYISLVFGLTTAFTIGLFYKAANFSRITLAILMAWCLLQAVIAGTGFYTVTDTLPPRFLLLVFPPLALIILLFALPKGRQFIDSLDAGTLTVLHTIRVPVEIVLFWLFVNKAIPELMTFEGRNFDIISGLTAPVVYYFGYYKKRLNNNLILLWNFICLGLLINIVGHAALSVPSPLQQLAFDQSNIAILYYPYNWLPCCVVPLVLFSHLVVIRKLRQQQT